jgi:AraC-like DNA-binding protein
MTASGFKHPLEPCPTCGRMIARSQLDRHRRTHDDPLSLLAATPEQVEEITRLYVNHNMLEVARMTHWSISTVQRVLERAGVQVRPRHLVRYPRHVDNETLLKTAQLYGYGLTMDEIAGLMGCTRSTVCRRLHSVGTKTRPPGGARRGKIRAPA